MPRQPFPKHLLNENGFAILDISALENRPAHAAALGLCLGLWPEVEAQLAALLGVLLRSETASEVAVYLTLRRSTARNETLKVAAQELDDRHEELLLAVLRIVSSVESERNYLAHSLWAYTPKLPDDIISYSQEAFTKFLSTQYPKNSKTNVHLHSKAEIVSKSMFIHKVSDLTRISDSIKSTQKLLLDFNSHLLACWHNPTETDKITGSYDFFCAQPLVAEALKVLREAAQRRANSSKDSQS